MAKVKYTGGVLEFRGSIGNMTYSIQKTGVATVRNKAAAISNPQSADQSAIRANLALLTGQWSAVLTQAQRDSWNTYALTKPGMGVSDGGILHLIKGNNGIMSGFNAFVLVNQWLRSVNKTATGQAPIGETPPTPPTNVAAVYAGGNMTISWTAPGTMKANAQARIWIGCHQSTCHRQLVATEEANAGTKVITGFKGAQGVVIPFASAPGDYFFQMDTVDVNGTKSGPSNTVEVTVT
jgi:hypothetical protein